MKGKSEKKEKKVAMYFNDAINKIDESIDYNEYSEVNSSAYFKNSLYKAEDEIDKMMSSPIMTDYRKYKKKKLPLYMLKNKKNFILRKIQWLKQKKSQEIENTKRSKNIFKDDPIMKRLYKINNDKIKSLHNKENQEQEEKINIKSVNILPKINTPYTINVEKINKNNESKRKLFKDKKREIKDILFSEPRSVSKTLNGKSINRLRNISNNSDNKEPLNYFFKNKNSDIMNLYKRENQNYDSSKQIMKNIFEEIDSLKDFEERRSRNLHSINNRHKLKKYRKLKIKVINSKDIEMKTFLKENIKKFKEDKNNKEAKVLKEYIQLKNKKDPLVRLSEKFAYFNRKPLLSLFNYDVKKKIIIDGPLAKLKVKDKKIMKGLENDNRAKNFLIRRLDEDQEKYITGGYFFDKNENEDEFYTKNNTFKIALNSDKNENDNDLDEEFNFTNIFNKK